MLTQSESQERKEAFWHKIVRLLRWEKPTGRLILIIPALWGIVLSAKGMPSISLVNLIIFFALATSATTCVINDLCDRDIDAQVERTRERPLASGALSVSVGIAVALICLVLNGILAFTLNKIIQQMESILKPLEFLERSTKNYGELFFASFFVNLETLVVSHPQDLQELFNPTNKILDSL